MTESTSYTCPLPQDKRQVEDGHRLVEDCREAECFYVDTERPEQKAANCLMMVAALLAARKEKIA